MKCSHAASATVLIAVLWFGRPTATAGADTFDPVDTTAMAHDHLAPDVRSRALGGAVVAVPDGPADVWWNPAAPLSGQTLRLQFVPLDWSTDIEVQTFAMAAEWRNLRLGLARTALEVEPLPGNVLPFRAAGESDDIDARTWTGNLGADLSPWLLSGHPRYNLAAGTSVRRMSDRFGSAKSAVWDMDIGLIGSRLGESGRSWWRVSTAAMVRNALGRDATFGESKLPVRQELRLGAALQAGRHAGAGRRQPLQAMVGYGRTQNLDDDEYANSDHWGFELTLFELLSPRAGYATRGFPRFWSWGGGLRLAEPRLLPVGLTVDYAREDWRELSGWQDQWAVGLSIDLE